MTSSDMLNAMTPVDKGVVMAYAEADMKPGIAVARFHMSHNGVYYHLLAVKAKTGLDPKRFFDLCKLVEMISAEREEHDRQS